jgi:hypothetical protein
LNVETGSNRSAVATTSYREKVRKRAPSLSVADP